MTNIYELFHISPKASNRELYTLLRQGMDEEAILHEVRTNTDNLYFELFGEKLSPTADVHELQIAILRIAEDKLDRTERILNRAERLMDRRPWEDN